MDQNGWQAFNMAFFYPHSITCRLSPGIDELVKQLKAKNTDVYLISGGFRQMINIYFLNHATSYLISHLFNTCAYVKRRVLLYKHTIPQTKILDVVRILPRWLKSDPTVRLCGKILS